MMQPRGPEADTIDRSATRLTDVIFGYGESDIRDSLEAIASEIGIRHIVHLQFASDKTGGASLPTAVATYSRSWQTHYFLNDYVHIDPVVARGRNAVMPFDWETLASDEPTVHAFFADAARHGVGRNGMSIPVRNGRDAHALVSFTSDHAKAEWAEYKRKNMVSLQKLTFLVDSAVNRNANVASRVRLSRREEECLILAARGKTDQEIADVLKIGFSSVKAHLDVARHKLHCMNLSHAIAVAIATGVIPAASLQ